MKDRAAKELASLRRLREVTALLSQESDPKKLVPLILDQAIALVGAERGFVILVAKGQLEVAAARNIDREEVRQPEAKMSRSIAQRVAQSGKAELIVDAQGHEGVRDISSVKAQELRSILCVPLRVHGQSLGVVYVDHRYLTGRFDEADLETLESFAVPAAVVLDATSRTQELERRGDELARRVGTIEHLRAELAERYRERSREANRYRAEAERLAPGAPGDEVPGIIARSPGMRRVLQLVKKVAPSDVPVLVLGESGSGKELLARAVHALSARRSGPFLAENCAALADPLLESELFGHEQGAFTGAVKAHAGLFELAKGGTLFLDEVGEMSPALQAKLLRVLQEREVRRVGGQERIPVDVRVVAATHRDLEAMVGTGAFRADLFYRLNVVRIEVPPLRERLDDVPALLDHFLAQAASSRGKSARPPRIEPQARELLLGYSWPGNVRELENEVRRLVVLAGDDGSIRPALLSPAVLGRHAPAAPSREPAADDAGPPITGVWKLDALEREMVVRALKVSGGNKTAAARLLGIPKSSLYTKLERFGLGSPAAE